MAQRWHQYMATTIDHSQRRFSGMCHSLALRLPQGMHRKVQMQTAPVSDVRPFANAKKRKGPPSAATTGILKYFATAPGPSQAGPGPSQNVDHDAVGDENELPQPCSPAPDVPDTDQASAASETVAIGTLRPTTSSACNTPIPASLASQDYSDMGLLHYLGKSLTDEERFKILNSAWTPPPTFAFPTHMEHGKTRKFQIQWLFSFPWLVYSRSSDGGVCKYCALFSNTQATLVTRPLTTCNKTPEKLKAHSQSSNHQASVTKASCFVEIMKGQQKNVQEQLSKGLANRIAENRQKMRSIVETVILCGRQNLPLRGNHEGHEDDRSNFRALLNFRISSGDKVLEEHLKTTGPKNATYTSSRIQNEVIDTIADYIRQKIFSQVKNSPFFLIIADEVTDVSNKEQLAFVLRYVDSAETPQERLVDFVECSEGITGAVLAKTMITRVASYGLDPSLIRGQGYDGAGNMSGHTNGAAALIQKDHPKALYFHCAAHQLNLCVAKSTESTYVRNMIGTIEKIGCFFDNHPKRQYALDKAIAEVAPNSSHKKLKDLCRTRWVARLDAFEVFIELLSSVAHCFETITEQGLTKWSRDSLTDSSQFLLAITQPSFIISLIMTSSTLSYIRGITIGLQAKALDIVRASVEVQTVVTALKNVRDRIDTYHDKWFAAASDICSAVGTEPALPRRCGWQRHRENTPADTPSDFFKRAVTIPLLDHIINEMQSRFTELHCTALKGIALVPSALVALPASQGNLDDFIDTYRADLPSPMTVAAEVECWQQKWLLHHSKDDLPETITDALRHSGMYPNIEMLLRILCSLPVTSCTAERAFSGLKRLKTYLRSSMGTVRMTGLALMLVHHDIDIDVEEVINMFARRHPRRMRMVNVLDD
ncbi:PREDICTED: 52 kDa repressor of the inhibitor of the protein kinase-like [Priapulus caudatus]|uniref:52 kDa repressor of the inhibitor of the protein kinase-like n=1 Tax=Priapulus caudatus TaxID=37621 RepID=A0ABM1ETU7_PRICU|nr:PREDICTED: 52 kDa repressor of the inhibitor of the protein kinase-like [Priapulus caudatus]